MMARRVWVSLAILGIMTMPPLMVGQGHVWAAGATKKADWRPTSAAKTKASPKTKAPAGTAAAAQVAPPTPEPSAPATVVDQSQEVLDIDFAVAANILAQGPRVGYGEAMSAEGVLYDANGASPTGQEAANNRFGSFPADVSLVRTPERALAAGGSGSSWGTYTIKRGEAVLSAGRYISVWRRETSGWKMISELAAGKTVVPPTTNASTGVLPKRPPPPPRSTPSPVGIPLTVPTPSPTTPSSEAPTPPTP
jgi:hypothetical protein